MSKFFKTFRRTQEDIISANLPNFGNITKRFDEPTFLSFRIVIAENSDQIYNIATHNAAFDTMPHPLFNIASFFLTTNETNDTPAPIEGAPDANQYMRNINMPTAYSTYDYLLNANEPTRAQMLIDFIEKFNTIQYEYPYYFQTIDGLGDLLKVNPIKGRRIPENQKITLTCLEGLDLRMSYLLNLYRKIAWDDVWQRWVLPEMMRYFTIKIYVSEFRVFHKSTSIDQINAIMGIQHTTNTPTFLSVLDGILPTYVITCEMCQFDIEDINYANISTLSVANDPTQVAIKFGIKVGNIKEVQIYPQFTHKYLIDRKLGGRNRSSDTISTLREDNQNEPDNILTQMAQHREHGSNIHISGLPYNERANTNNIHEVKYASRELDGSMIPNINPVDPATWTGNLLTTGKSYVKRMANRLIDNAKITQIPQLGVSFSEVRLAIQAKNVIGALGLIRKGINETIKMYGNAPSENLHGPIETDNIFKEFLNQLTISRATDEETTMLADVAREALRDNVVWNSIKQRSIEDNAIKQPEPNINKKIEDISQIKYVKENAPNLLEDTQVITLPNVSPNAASGKIVDNEIMKKGTLGVQNDTKLSNTINQPPASNNLNQPLNSNDSMLHPMPSIDFENTINNTPLYNKNLSQGSQNFTDLNTSNLQKINKDVNIDNDKSIINNVITQNKPSSKLTSKIDDNNHKIDNTSTIKVTTISNSDILEYSPTSMIYKQISTEKIDQPENSKATNSKLQQ